jgi:predicted aminopeptidase
MVWSHCEGSYGIGYYGWMGIWDGAINIARRMVFGIWDSWILVFSKLYEYKQGCWKNYFVLLK